MSEEASHRTLGQLFRHQLARVHLLGRQFLGFDAHSSTIGLCSWRPVTHCRAAETPASELIPGNLDLPRTDSSVSKLSYSSTSSWVLSPPPTPAMPIPGPC